MADAYPDAIQTEAELDDLLARPTPALVDFMRELDGDLIFLGVGGKMGLSVARTALNACRAAGVSKRVIGVDRFRKPGVRVEAQRLGLETIACDFLEPDAVAALPRVRNVIFLAGRKFGTTENQTLTWAINTVVPANVARHFRDSRIVVFSTGCVYPLVAPATGGCPEAPPPAPVGEYAQSCLGRERVFEFYSQQFGTPVCLYRLNYAVDLRYGVLNDLGSTILRGEPVSVGVGHFNVIWQGDAAVRALLCLKEARSPAVPLNVTGPELLTTRAAAEELARLMGRPVSFTGSEGGRDYLNDAARSFQLWGPPG